MVRKGSPVRVRHWASQESPAQAGFPSRRPRRGRESGTNLGPIGFPPWRAVGRSASATPAKAKKPTDDQGEREGGSKDRCGCAQALPVARKRSAPSRSDRRCRRRTGPVAVRPATTTDGGGGSGSGSPGHAGGGGFISAVSPSTATASAVLIAAALRVCGRRWVSSVPSGGVETWWRWTTSRKRVTVRSRSSDAPQTVVRNVRTTTRATGRWVLFLMGGTRPEGGYHDHPGPRPR